MQGQIGSIVLKHREGLRLTQQAYGRRYGVSGPAIFKFEKAIVRPSFPLWLRIARDACLPRPWAVLVWLRDALPAEYREHVDLHGAWSGGAPEPESRPAPRAGYSRCSGRAAILQHAAGDPGFPPALLELLRDDEFWGLYRPDGAEIQRLLDIFAPLGGGSKELYRQALVTLRLFVKN